jgi:uncharacterized membrane protein YeaQ/YmgE (transglycosylase-associated protein family)
LRFATVPERIIQSINIAVWLAVGAALGWFATRLKPSADRVVFAETLAVGIFGSFIGGEFVAAMLASSKGAALSFAAVALAVGCSVAALFLLGLMRRAVGPLRPGKPKPRR